MRSQKKQISVPIIFLCLTILACSLVPGSNAREDSNTDPDGDTSQAPQPIEDGSLLEIDCQALGLPCTPGEVDPGILERTSEIQANMLAYMQDGETIADIVRRLEAMEEVRMVLSSEYGYVFVLEGGIFTGYFDPVIAYKRPPISESSTGNQPDTTLVRPQARPIRDIVGNDTARENDERRKRALVLSPFDFEYQLPDAGAGAVAVLEAIPDYKGQVDFFQDEDATISTFTGWKNYDFILYNGHSGLFAGRDNENNLSYGLVIITTGVEVSGTDSCNLLRREFEDLGGIFCLNIPVRIRGEDGNARDVVKSYYAIMPSFLSQNNSAGLEKAVIIINSCQSFRDESFKNLLSGAGSVFFGWSNSVIGPFADSTIEELVRQLGRGYKSERAYNLVCSSSSGCTDTDGTRLIRSGPPKDLRIREVVEFLHPITKAPLDHGDRLYIRGYPEDNQADQMPFFVEIRGIEPNDPLEKFTLSFEINGQTVAESWTLENPNAFEKWFQEDRDRFRVFDWITLPEDFEQGQDLQLQAILELEEQGKSKSVLMTTLAANPLFEIRSNYLVEKEGQKIGGTMIGQWPLSLKDIEEDQLIFESLDERKLLTYENSYLEISGCDAITPQTREGSLKVFEAVFRRATFTNTDFAPPVSFVFNPQADNAEWFEFSCGGGSGSTPETNQWFPTFQLLSENKFVENGVSIDGWREGAGEVIARFFTEFSKDGISGDYLLTIK